MKDGKMKKITFASMKMAKIAMRSISSFITELQKDEDRSSAYVHAEDNSIEIWAKIGGTGKVRKITASSLNLAADLEIEKFSL